MFRLPPQCLLAVFLGFGAVSPAPLLGIFDGMAVARADDDDGADDDDDDRPARPGRQTVQPTPGVRSSAEVRPPPPARSNPKPRPPLKPQPAARPVAQHNPTFEPREVLATDADAALLDQAKSLGFAVGQTVVLSEMALRVTRLRAPARWSAPQALQILRQRIPSGDFVLNHRYRIKSEPCRDGRCYGSALIGWRGSARCGGGLKLGMVDTAADKGHAALNGRKITTRSFAEDGRASPAPHGTAVATLLVGAPDSDFPGLLPAAELYAADTFTGGSRNPRTNALLLVQGLDWLLQQRVTVVNLSLTGSENRLVHEALKRLNQRNVWVVAAAGNEGPSAPPAYPAAYPETVSVTAVDSLLRPYRLANRGDYVTVAAPGVRIWTPGSQGGQYRDGTSFAAPYVTAVAAVLRNRQPDWKLANLIAHFQTSARDLGASGKDPVFGWGLVQNPVSCD